MEYSQLSPVRHSEAYDSPKALPNPARTVAGLAVKAGRSSDPALSDNLPDAGPYSLVKSTSAFSDRTNSASRAATSKRSETATVSLGECM